ncbi:hypothetical protein [Enterococcus casseliflavus]|uniref:hypothetical protein n=1 Tax=Enterococcus TaxID=1350 RepID=UPI0039A72EA1
MSETEVRNFDWIGANKWWQENKPLIRSRQHIERMKGSMVMNQKEEQVRAI